MNLIERVSNYVGSFSSKMPIDEVKKNVAAIINTNSCILCHGTADMCGLFIPKEHCELQKIYVYMACKECLSIDGAPDRVEDVLIKSAP
jgi:hypothetical protein